MDEDFSDVKLPGEMSIDEWFIGDEIPVWNDFEEGPYDPDWDIVGELAGDQLCDYLDIGWRRAGVRITWDEVDGWWHEEDSTRTVCKIHVFGPKSWIDQYKESAAKDHYKLDGPWPVTKLKTGDHDMPFYESKTRELVELDEAARKKKKKRKLMSPEEWKAYWRKKSDEKGVFHLYVDANDPDVLEAQYRDFISDRTNDSDVEYGDDNDKIPQFSTTIHGGAIECAMTFHTWQDAEKFMIDVYGEGLPADQWEEQGWDHPDFLVYGEDYGQDLE